MSASEAAELAEEEERRKKRAPWGVIALVLLTGLALIRNGSGEFDEGPPQPASAAAADSRVPGGHLRRGRAAAAVLAAGPGQDPRRSRWTRRSSRSAWTRTAGSARRRRRTRIWRAGSPAAVAPGEKGTAVVVGHVDNHTGPGRVLRARRPEEGKSRRDRPHRTERRPCSRSTASRCSRRTTSPATASTPRRAARNCGSSPAEAVSPSRMATTGNVVAFARLVEVR